MRTSISEHPGWNGTSGRRCDYFEGVDDEGSSDRRYSLPLLARAAVDRLSKQVGVAVVAGVFLDQVTDNPPQ